MCIKGLPSGGLRSQRCTRFHQKVSEKYFLATTEWRELIPNSILFTESMWK